MELWERFRGFLGLSLQLAKAQFRIRNEGSYLGILWYLLNPLLLFILLYLIFSTRLGKGIPHYPLFLLLGIIMFNFFQSFSTESAGIIRSNSNVIKSIIFPRESLIGASVLRALFSHIFEIIVLIIFFLFFKISIINFIFYPLILIFFIVFCFGIGLFLSSLSVYFIDLNNIWHFAVRLIWFGTPIFYAIEGQTRLFYLNLFNPIFYFITITREILIYNKIPELEMILGMISFTLLSLFIGLLFFNKLKGRFAELI
jgi:lipopolysaccharide transport system permease protein